MSCIKSKKTSIFNMKSSKSSFLSFGMISGVIILFLALLTSSCHDVNCLPDSHFDEEGNLIEVPDSPMVMQQASKVKFFMEASGSMNGLYRPGCRTEFRDDVYQIISYFLSDNDNVFTLCLNNGTDGYAMPLNTFGNAIKKQGFQSMGTTSITDMIETVIKNIDTENQEVGVLISDMKFDPDGSNNINYQLGMYTTKVSHITSETNLALSLVAATSKYYDNKNNVVADKSPYYFVILGNSENVAKVRDDISTMLYYNNNFVDNIETGMKYDGIGYTIEKKRNCIHKRKSSTLTDVNLKEPCKFVLNLDLENYRWAIANEEVIKSLFSCRMLHGGKVEVDSVSIDSVYKDSNHRLNRKITASIYLTVSNLLVHCDVMEWSFDPCKFDTYREGFTQFFGAETWTDFSRTYSIEYFLDGMFRAANLSTCSKKPNYVLISKH